MANKLFYVVKASGRWLIVRPQDIGLYPGCESCGPHKGMVNALRALKNKVSLYP